MARPCHRAFRPGPEKSGRTLSPNDRQKKAGRLAAGITTYSNSFQERPSRVIIATDATGPQVPA